MAIQSTGVLQIVGAAYGLKQVTAQVIKQVNRQSFPETLCVLASNRAFGDTWIGHEKTLTVVYRYDGGPTFVATASEGQTLNIGAQQFEQAIRTPASTSEDSTAQPALTVWGASFGSADVSATVRNLADHSTGSLSLVADSTTLGETSKEKRNTFVIVASYSGQVPFVDIVVEGNPYALSYRPPLHILSAFYGLKDVTDIVRASVSRRRLSVAASSSVFGDGWPAMRKTLHVVYQYADRKPQMAATTENQLLHIDYDPAAPAGQASLDPRALNIIAAAYGPVDVTEKVAALVENASLSFTADSLTFGDTWPAAVKSFSMVYSWGVAAVSSVNVPEDTPVSITQPEPAFTTDRNYVSLAGLLAAGDEIKLQTAAGGYWSIAADGQITALETSSDAAEVFTIGMPEAQDAAAITLQCRDGSYVIANSDGLLRAGGSAQEALQLMASLQANGAINIGVVGGAVAPFIAVTASGAIAVDGSYDQFFHLLQSAAEPYACRQWQPSANLRQRDDDGWSGRHEAGESGVEAHWRLLSSGRSWSAAWRPAADRSCLVPLSAALSWRDEQDRDPDRNHRLQPRNAGRRLARRAQGDPRSGHSHAGAAHDACDDWMDGDFVGHRHDPDESAGRRHECRCGGGGRTGRELFWLGLRDHDGYARLHQFNGRYGIDAGV